MTEEMRLTADGAARLRVVRERFREQPECYTNHLWFCGSRGCVAGWLVVGAGETVESSQYPIRAAELLGLSWGYGGPIGALFTSAHDSPATAIDAIDAFLWHYGYPPNALDDNGTQELPVVPVAVGSAGNPT